MKKFLSFIAILLLFLLFSCKGGDENELGMLFSTGCYEEVISKAGKALESGLDPDAIYYRAAANFRLGNIDSAESSAYLFLLLYGRENPHYFECAEILLRSTDDDSLLLYSGDILHENGMLNRVDYLLYYRALYSNNLFERARDFYYAIENSLSPYEKAVINIRSNADSNLIVSSLEALYSFSGLDSSFISLMKRAIRMFIQRGDQAMLLDLIGYGDGSDPSYEILIGDLMFSLGKLDSAASYWLKAASSYPRQAELRLDAI